MTNDVRLEHAFLYVADLERSLAFYGRLFPDWTVRWEGTNGGSGRWAHWGPPGEGQPSYLSLCEHWDTHASPAPDGALSIQHIGFAHPDVEALVARLQPLGIRPSERAGDNHWRRVYFEDPDGHELEFVERRD